MVRAPPAYCGGRSVTPRKIAAATAARAGSRVLVTANSVGVMRLRLACDRLKAIAVAATTMNATRPATAAGSPDACAVHGGQAPGRGPDLAAQHLPAAGHAHADQPAGIDVMAGEQVLGREAAEGPQRGGGRGRAEAGDALGRAGRASRVQARQPPPPVRPGSL